MKFVIFLVTCLVVADADCECPEGDSALEEAAKNAWCNDSVNFVGLVTVRRSGNPEYVDGKHFRTYQGSIHVDPADVYKSTTLQRGGKQSISISITIHMPDNGCSLSTGGGGGSIMLGGTLSQRPSNILTITECAHEIWKSQKSNALTWKEDQNFCKDYKEGKKYDDKYDENCINWKSPTIFAMEESQKERFRKDCFNPKSKKGEHSLLELCTADFVGFISRVSPTQDLFHVDNAFKESEEFEKLNTRTIVAQIHPKCKGVKLARGILKKEENKQILDVTSCAPFWRGVEGKVKELESEDICEEAFIDIQIHSQPIEWCLYDFAGAIWVRGSSNRPSKVFPVEAKNYRSKLNITHAILNDDCIKKMVSKRKTRLKQLGAIGNVTVSGEKAILNVTNCDETWLVSKKRAEKLNTRC